MKISQILFIFIHRLASWSLQQYTASFIITNILLD